MKRIISLMAIIAMIIVASCKKGGTDNNPSSDGGGTGNTQSLAIDNSFNGVSGNCPAMALQSDGKIIVAGSFGTAFNYSYKIYRLNVNGDIDNSFNSNLSSIAVVNSFSYVAIAPDGKILLAGDFTINGVRKILIRLSASGAYDSSFGPPTFNKIASNTLPYLSKIIPQADGKILIAGVFNAVSGKDYNYLARLTNTGAIDATFAFAPVGNAANEIDDLLLLPSGGMFISGYFVVGTDANRRHGVAKLNNDGSTDLSFNFVENIYSATLGSGYSGYVTRMALQSDGKLVIGGGFVGIENTTIKGTSYNYNRMGRLNANGSVDLTFTMPDGPSKDLTAMLVLPDNRLLTGHNISLNGANGQILTLYSKDGVLDNSFNLNYSSYGVLQILKQSDGKYLLAGTFGDSANHAIIRLSN